MRTISRDERGQSMILVALSVIVLIGALALAADWGYALTQRRVMQTSADAAALGAGRLLATSVIGLEGGTAFSVTREEAWCAAARYVNGNDAFRPIGATPTFTLELGSGADPIAWTEVPQPVGGCPTDGVLPTPADTRYVRVTAGITYHSLVSGVIGFPTTTASASARAKLSGTPVPLSGPIWPMVRHYDPADFEAACAPPDCDPTTVEPLTFWSANEDDMVYGNFKGVVDLSRDSPRFAATTRQLITEWDQTGPKTDLSGNCGGPWDTAGGEDPQQQDKQCSIPNWFGYAFQGTLSLERDWGAELPDGQEAPAPLSAQRQVCDELPVNTDAPSCEEPGLGDWVETAYGNVGTNMSDNMKALIASPAGFDGPFSDLIIPNGPNKGEPYGRALTVLVYLWDCAETFSSSAPVGEQWSLILPSHGPADCSQVPPTGNAPTPDRVHLFTVAPFTFYAGLVSSQEISGYWGGAFGDARACRDCALNPLANTAFLVPDDDSP